MPLLLSSQRRRQLQKGTNTIAWVVPMIFLGCQVVMADAVETGSAVAALLSSAVVALPSGVDLTAVASSNISNAALAGLAFAGGSCSEIQLAGAQVYDRGEGLKIQLDYSFHKLAAVCTLQGTQGNTLLGFDLESQVANLTLALPSINFNAFTEPPVVDPSQVASCDFNFRVFNLLFSGPASMTLELNAQRKPEMATLLASQIELMFCQELQMLSWTMTMNLWSFIAPAIAGLVQIQQLERPMVLSTLVDWREYPILLLATAMLEQKFKVLRDELTVDNPEYVLETSTAFELSKEILLRLTSVRLDGFSTIGTPGLLGGANQSVNLSLFAGDFSIATSLSLELPESKLQAGESIVSPATISLELQNFSVALDLLAMVGQSCLDGLRLGQPDLVTCASQCARAAVDPSNYALGVEDAQLLLSALDLRMNSLDPLMDDLLVTAATTANALLGRYLETFTSFVSVLITQNRVQIVDFVWSELAALGPCTNEISTLAPQLSWILACAITLAVLIIALFIANGIFGVAFCRWKLPGYMLPIFAPAVWTPENDAERSLGFHDDVPRVIGVVFLLVTMIISCLLLYGQVNISATLSGVVEGPTYSTDLGVLLSFSLRRTIEDMWMYQEGRFSAVFIVIFSGIWPHTKVLLLIVVWLVPPRYLRSSVRGRLLTVLEHVGKYSFLDSWFLVLGVAALTLRWEGGDAALNLILTPSLGFHMFFLGTVLSLVLTNVALDFHRHVTTSDSPFSKLTALRLCCGYTSRLAQQGPDTGRTGAFAPDQGSTRNVATVKRDSGVIDLCNGRVDSSSRRCLHSTSYVGMVVLIGFALGLDSVKIVWRGVAGDVLQQAGESTSYSIAKLARGMASHQGTSGIAWLQSFFVVTVFFFPVLLFGLLTIVWMRPLSLVRRIVILRVCSWLDRWAMFDAFGLLLAIAKWQSRQTARDLARAGRLGFVCAFIENQLGLECAAIDIVPELPGFLILMLAAFLAFVVPKIALQTLGSTLADHSDKVEVSVDREPGEQPPRPVLLGCDSASAEIMMESKPADGEANDEEELHNQDGLCRTI